MPKAPKQGKAKRDGAINPQISMLMNFKHGKFYVQ